MGPHRTEESAVTPWNLLEPRGHCDAGEPHGTRDTSVTLGNLMEPQGHFVISSPHENRAIVTLWGHMEPMAIVTPQIQGGDCDTEKPHGPLLNCEALGNRGEHSDTVVLHETTEPF